MIRMAFYMFIGFAVLSFIAMIISSIIGAVGKGGGFDFEKTMSASMGAFQFSFIIILIAVFIVPNVITGSNSFEPILHALAAIFAISYFVSFIFNLTND